MPPRFCAPEALLVCAVALLAAAAPCGGGSASPPVPRPGRGLAPQPPLRAVAALRLRGGWRSDPEELGEGLRPPGDEGEESGHGDSVWEDEERKIKEALVSAATDQEEREASGDLDSDEEWWQQNKRKFEGINKTWAEWGKDYRNETVVGERYAVGDFVVPRGNEDHHSERMRRLLERSTNSEGLLDDDEVWWRAQDDDAVAREAIQDFLDETVCCGTGPHTMIGYRFGGRKARDPAQYAHPNETDAEMLQRHFFGYADNATLMGLHKLHVAVECRDHEEIERLVAEDGVDVNGMVDTLGEERALHFAAWNGDRDTCRLLVRLGACPNARNYYNQTAMHRAAAGGYTALCDDLHAAGALPLEEDALEFTPPAWAAAFNKNETTQWFYAKFAYRNGSGFPLGPAPFYGLEQNEGYDWCCPYEDLANETSSYFLDNHVDPADTEGEVKEEDVDRVFNQRCKLMEAKVAYMEEDMRKAEERKREIREAKEQKRKEMGLKRKKVAMGEFPEFFRDQTDLFAEDRTLLG